MGQGAWAKEDHSGALRFNASSLSSGLSWDWTLLPYCLFLLLLEWTCLLLFSHLVVSDSLWPPWSAACQASLSCSISWRFLKLMTTELMMPSNHLSFASPPTLNLSQHQGLFQWIGCSHQAARVLELQLQQQSSPLLCFVSKHLAWFHGFTAEGICLRDSYLESHPYLISMVFGWDFGL